MKILFAASEAAPLAKTGGLADVAAALPAALAARGHDVRVVLPFYASVDPASCRARPTGAVVRAAMAGRLLAAEIWSGALPSGVPVYLVRCDPLFGRPGLYGDEAGDYPDNAERFALFSRAVAALPRAVGFEAGVLHLNDWQTGPAALLVRLARRRGEPGPAVVFTVHNLAFQGIFPPRALAFLGVGPEVFTPAGIEFYGKVNFLKAGLVYADLLTTVSRTYAAEILTPEYGCGLEGSCRSGPPTWWGSSTAWTMPSGTRRGTL